MWLCGMRYIWPLLAFNSSVSHSDSKSKNERKKTKVFIFYGFKCHQNEVLAEGVRPHAINFAVLQIQCEKCRSNNDTHIQGNLDHPGEETIERDGLLAKFFDIIQASSLKFNSIFLIAHNFQGYDKQFLLKYLLEKLQWDLKIDTCGGLIKSI